MRRLKIFFLLLALFLCISFYIRMVSFQNSTLAAAKYSLLLKLDVNHYADEDLPPLLNAVIIDSYARSKSLITDGSSNINIQTKEGMTPLMFASGNNNLPLVILLLKNGAEVNKNTADGVSALMFASILDNKDIVQILKKYGAK